MIHDLLFIIDEAVEEVVPCRLQIQKPASKFTFI